MICDGTGALFSINLSGQSLGDDLTLDRELALGAIDQRGSDLLLEAGDVGREVALHGVQGSRGGGEGLMFGHGEKRVELAEIHRCE